MQETLTRNALRWAGIVAALLAAGYVATLIPHTLAIFTLAAIIAFGTAPLTYRLETRMPRGVAIAVVYSFLLIAICVVVIVVVPAAVTQAQTFLEAMPLQIDHAQNLLDTLGQRLQGRFGRSFNVGLENVRDIANARIQTAATTAFASLGAVLLNVFTGLFIFISALVLSAFFVSRSESIAAGFRGLFPPHRRQLADQFEHEVARVFGGFVAGQITLCGLAGTLVCLALISLHAPFAILVGVLTAIGYAVPFFGMLVVQLLAAVLAAPLGWSMTVWVTVAIFVIARIVDTVITPKVMSDSVGVSPIAVMFAVFAGGELFGVTGLVLGIPAAAMIKTAWTVYRSAQADERLMVEENGRTLPALEIELADRT